MSVQYWILSTQFATEIYNYIWEFYISDLWCLYKYYCYGAVYCFHLQGTFGRIPLLQLVDGKYWKSRVSVPLVGTRRKAENRVLICTKDDRVRNKCGIDWRKSAWIWVMDGRPLESRVQQEGYIYPVQENQFDWL
jgi:hypothetical protein